MRSVTSDRSVIVPPKGISRVLPSGALVNRKETEHDHGASEWVSLHSVGHLETQVRQRDSDILILERLTEYKFR
jgi:hypothetical protein